MAYKVIRENDKKINDKKEELVLIEDIDDFKRNLEKAVDNNVEKNEDEDILTNTEEETDVIKEDDVDDSEVLESIEKAASEVKKVESVKRSIDAEEQMINMAIGNDEDEELLVEEDVISDSKDVIDAINVTGLNSEDDSSDDFIQEEVNAIQDEVLNGKHSEPASTIIKTSKINEDVEDVDVEEFVNEGEEKTDNKVKSAKKYITDFISYIGTGALMREIRKQSRKAGVSEKKVAKTVIEKFLGVIGDIIGTTIHIVGDIFKCTVNTLYYILTKGADIITSIASKITHFVTFGFTAKES